PECAELPAFVDFPAAAASLWRAASRFSGLAMYKNRIGRRAGRLSAAIAVLLCVSVAAMPALAADQACTDGDIDTDQGAEESEGTTGENTTCHAEASAYGRMNIASGNFSNAFGYLNVASGARAKIGRA